MRTVEDSCKCELPYTSYVALLNQEDENAPVANVLENNTGYTITWVYDSIGNFYATGIDSEAVVWVIGGDPVNNYQTTKTRWTGTIITIEQAGLSWNYDPIPMNYLDNFAIEIRIY